jgi:hypothetical protein
MNIVGLGNAGCQIAKTFQNYEQYQVFCIDVEDKGYPTFLQVEHQNSHEDYEKNYKKLKLSKCKGETTFILCGTGNISGCALRVLQQIKDSPVTVIYIKSDLANLSHEQKLKDRATFGILQHYARSALLKDVYIVSNQLVERAIDGISIKSYWSDINNIISSTYHMLNVFDNTEPLLTTASPRPITARIATLGVVNYETNKENMFYDLQYPRLKKYFYGINENSIEEDKEILHKIRAFVNQKAEKNIAANFSIFSTSYEHNYIYSTHYASFIQEQKIE